MLILRPPWDSQPQEAVGVDWGNPITRGLVAASIGPGDASDLTIYTAPNGFTAGIGRAGREAQLNSAAPEHFTSSAASIVTGAPFTALAVASVTTVVGAQALFVVFGTTTAAHELYVSGSSLGMYSVAGSGSEAKSAAGAVAVGEYFVAAGRVASATSRDVWKNGVLLASNAVSRAPAAATINRWGLYSGVTDRLSGSLALRLAWNRALSDSEMAAVGVNPWQVFTPRRIWIPVSAAAGGGATATLTGASSTASAGTLAATGAATATLASASATSAVGTITASGAASTALTGAAATASAGTVLAFGAASITLTGASASASVGAMSATGAAQIVITGAAATASAGTISATAGGSGTATLTGAAATASAGTVTATGAASTALTGASATASVGAITASAAAGGSATATLTGASASASAGTLTATGAASVTLPSAAAVAACGTITAMSGALADPERTYLIPPEARVLTLAAESRIYTVPAESRTHTPRIK